MDNKEMTTQKYYQVLETITSKVMTSDDTPFLFDVLSAEVTCMHCLSHTTLVEHYGHEQVDILTCYSCATKQ